MKQLQTLIAMTASRILRGVGLAAIVSACGWEWGDDDTENKESAGSETGGSSTSPSSNNGGNPGTAGSPSHQAGSESGQGGEFPNDSIAGAGGNGNDHNCVQLVAESECNVLTQCGCGIEQGCYFRPPTSGAGHCAPRGAAERGSPCQYQEDCQPGNICFSGVCQRLCARNTDCISIAADSMCTQLDTTDGSGSMLDFCSDHCQPVDRTSCREGQACTIVTAQGEYPGTSACVQAGNSTTGCSDSTLCAKGYVCAVDSGTTSGHCYQWCRAGSNLDCPASKTCYPINYWLGTEEFGLCN